MRVAGQVHRTPSERPATTQVCQSIFLNLQTAKTSIMIKSLSFLLLLFFSFSLFSQTNYQPAPENIQNRKDFQDRKFGMFIHWGIYSLLGDGEWVMYTQKIPFEKYKRIANAFYPHDFNAREWVQIAKAAGMKYITITSSAICFTTERSWLMKR